MLVGRRLQRAASAISWAVRLGTGRSIPGRMYARVFRPARLRGFHGRAPLLAEKEALKGKRTGESMAAIAVAIAAGGAIKSSHTCIDDRGGTCGGPDEVGVRRQRL